MAFEIVDGMTGTKHISSDDLSALNIATIGESNCVLNYGDNFKLTMTNANTATLGTGVGMVGGKRFWNQAATSLTIQSGTQGQKRNDLVVARYAKTSAGIESITPVVIKGTPTTGTAADPEVTANDLKLWRVPLNGISVGEPVKLFEPVASLATIGDSVSQSEWKVLKGNMDDNHLAYKICNGICYLSIDCGGTWNVKAAARAETNIATLPDEALPSAYSASAACYPKQGTSFTDSVGVRVDRKTKKLSVRNTSSSSCSYYSVDFCYPV